VANFDFSHAFFIEGVIPLIPVEFLFFLLFVFLFLKPEDSLFLIKEIVRLTKIFRFELKSEENNFHLYDEDRKITKKTEEENNFEFSEEYEDEALDQTDNSIQRLVDPLTQDIQLSAYGPYLFLKKRTISSFK
jgi:hypothetical protein